MSMKVVFLKDTVDHKAGWEGFISRQLGRRLCYQEIAIPWSIRHDHAGYNEMIKAKKKKDEAEPTAKKKPGRKRAVSVKAETRETAISEQL